MRTPKKSYCPRRNVLLEVPPRIIVEKECRVSVEMWFNMAAASGNGLVWVPSACERHGGIGPGTECGGKPRVRNAEKRVCVLSADWTAMSEPGKSRRCFPCVGTPMRDGLLCVFHAPLSFTSKG